MKKYRLWTKSGLVPVMNNSACHYNKPSGAYHKVILDGAIEHELPSSYIQKLKDTEHNGIFDIPMLRNIENNEKEEREPEPVL